MHLGVRVSYYDANNLLGHHQELPFQTSGTIHLPSKCRLTPMIHDTGQTGQASQAFPSAQRQSHPRPVCVFRFRRSPDKEMLVPGPQITMGLAEYKVPRRAKMPMISSLGQPLSSHLEAKPKAASMSTPQCAQCWWLQRCLRQSRHPSPRSRATRAVVL